MPPDVRQGEVLGVTDEAFARPATVSQRLDIRVVRIAERVAETGEDVGGDERRER